MASNHIKYETIEISSGSSERTECYSYFRKTSPEMTIKLWKIINTFNAFHINENQLNEYLIKHFINYFGFSFDKKRVNQLICNAIEDKLIVIENNDSNGFIRFKPNINRWDFNGLTNDWLCFECHSCNEKQLLFNCKHCFRAFHKNCLKETIFYSNNDFECEYCLKLRQRDDSIAINCVEKRRLNKLLRLLINNLEIYNKCNDLSVKFFIENSDESKILIFKWFDFKTMRYNVMNNFYESLQLFENHFKLFVHNYVVWIQTKHSFDHKLRQFVKVIQQFNHEISEIKLCVHCYEYSSDPQLDDDNNPYKWFTKVCDPPHELVLARMSPYPYWPSKVIAIKDNGLYDVRFFDPPNFSRLDVSKDDLKSIEFKQAVTQELEEPLSLMDLHISQLKQKGVQFKKTIFD